MMRATVAEGGAVRWRTMFRSLAALITIGFLFEVPEMVFPQTPPESKQAKQDKEPSREAKSPEQSPRIELNLAGKTDTASGESRRNENIPFNAVDNNALKELNVRLGTTATVISEFSPASGYFSSEFGNSPTAAVSVPAGLRRGFHGNAFWSHRNSVFSARSFFQVGDVEPARDNGFGAAFGVDLPRGAGLYLEGGSETQRGSVNGNVLVPKADERTPLTTDPEDRAIVERFLNAYPKQLPNRTDVNPRALNTNAPQSIDNKNALIRLDSVARNSGRLSLQYGFISQMVDAFQLVAGQNPDTQTKSHRARIVWTASPKPGTAYDLSAGFDRIRSQLTPEPNAVGPMVSTSGLETLGPQGSIPIDRAHNVFRYAGMFTRQTRRHLWTAGGSLLRRQFNGVETDTHRGYFSFANDFGRTGIENLRLGAPTQYIISVGDVRRGFRSWSLQGFAGDRWTVDERLTLSWGLRYEVFPTPTEVNDRNTVAFGCDCNNAAPRVGAAYNLPGTFGVLRAAFGLHFGEIFPVTYSQIRLSPPGSVKIMVPVPDLSNPMGETGKVENARGNLYLLDPELATPYSYQYNLAWEPDWSRNWRLQLAYVGSRSHKLLIMWYLNRGHVVPGIPQTSATLNDRRPDPRFAEKRWVLNGSDGYYDAARVSLAVPRWRGLSLDASYWFSKAIDLGASYTNTAYDVDSRQSRSQSEGLTQKDMKGPSNFDQPHAFLCRFSYDVPHTSARGLDAIAGGWNISAVVLVKSGTPFTVVSGSDGPGYGNVDGNGNDRPNLLAPEILGRTIGDPDTSRRMLPRSAFYYMAPTDERGNLGRGTFRKGGIHNVNAALSRAWVLRPPIRLTFRAESINLLNTPQFSEPGTELANANFGQITNTLNDGRTFRFTFQLGW
jgi:hypothetical protein